MLTAIAAVFVFLMVILFHEFGHFIIAKAVGIKVNEFSIGMGPKILQKEKGETKYSVRALPIGGYVSMEGEDENSDDPRSFNKVPAISRIAVVVAGATMNFILAIIVLSIFSFSVGMPTTTVLETLDGSPAENVGIEKGDTILEINDVQIKNWDSIVNEINSSNPNKNMKVTVLRNGDKKDYILKPEISKDNRVIIGIVPTSEKSFMSAIKGGVQRLVHFLC